MAVSRLSSRCLAEAFAGAFLLLAIVGSGIMAGRLYPDQEGARLLANSLASAAGLLALILCFAEVSGAHFNPLVTLWAVWAGKLPGREAAPYLGAQFLGAVLGAILANLCFGLAPILISSHCRSGAELLLGEVLASLGLVVIVARTARLGGAREVALAVAGWILCAYWCTSSTAFANPAVTLARTLTESFAGIAPSSVPAFLLAQGLGLVLALLVLRGLDGPREQPVE